MHGCAGIGNLLTSNGFFAEPVLELGRPSSRSAGCARSRASARR